MTRPWRRSRRLPRALGSAGRSMARRGSRSRLRAWRTRGPRNHRWVNLERSRICVVVSLVTREWERCLLVIVNEDVEFSRRLQESADTWTLVGWDWCSSNLASSGVLDAGQQRLYRDERERYWRWHWVILPPQITILLIRPITKIRPKSMQRPRVFW